MRCMILRATDTLYDGHFSIAPEWQQRTHRGMQRDTLVQRQHALARYRNVLTQRVVSGIGERNDGVQTIVSAFQFDQNNQLARRAARCACIQLRRYAAARVWRGEDAWHG